MTAAIDAVKNIPTGGDPVIETLKWIAVMVLVVLLGATPVMHYLRKYNSDRAANARDGAELALYQSLGEQVTSLKRELEGLYARHTELVMEHAKVSSRLSKVEEYEATIRSLKSKLDMKEGALIAKDEELRNEREHNRMLTREVLSLKDRIAHLERHLSEVRNPQVPLPLVSSSESEAANG